MASMLYSSDAEPPTSPVSSPHSVPSSSSQVILHDPSKQKIVLYDPRSQQITLCQGRWYNNNVPINLSSFFQQHGYFNHFPYESASDVQFCPMCHQRVPSVHKSAASGGTGASSLTFHHTMHRDYFMLLDRAHATDSRRNNNTFRSKRNRNDIKSVSQDALNSGYYRKFFQNVKKLGSGSYGTVHLVKHVMHDICLGYFAIKIIPVGDQLPRLIEILREVRALQRLHHRNVIDYKHSWLEDYQGAINGPLVPCLFILMEYADFGNVMDYIMGQNDDTKRKWLSEHEIWTIMFETCMGLQHLHEYGIVHRDLKPGNLLMTSLHRRHRIDFEDLELYDTNYRIVLSDLGQSDFLDAHERGPRTGDTGTLGFAAPELILNHDEWDESVDVWSLGHILYFLTFSAWPYDTVTCDVEEDETVLYRGIMNGSFKLLTPQRQHLYTRRSQTIVQMIDELCCVEARQRPSLHWIIHSISNILKSHQYITINSKRKSLSNALPPPQGIPDTNADLTLYPVIKYEPKNDEYNAPMLRRRRRRRSRKVDRSTSASDDDVRTKITKENNKMEMRMVAYAMKQPFKWIINNGTIRLAMHLMVKMQFIVIVAPSIPAIATHIYICVSCVLLCVMFTHQSRMEKKKYVFAMYGCFSLASYLCAFYLHWHHIDIVMRSFVLFGCETLLSIGACLSLTQIF